MKVAIIGSRSINNVNLKKHLPINTSEIVSGGAIGVDRVARNYATKKGIPIKEYLPDYARYGKIAPLKRNIEIIEYADIFLKLKKCIVKAM